MTTIAQPPPPSAPPARRGDWFLTFTGRQFYVCDPRPEDVDIVDIAHALARVCRFGGHVRVPLYSVAQHSLLVARIVVERGHRELELVALLHDATEAYVGDVIRPLKRALPGYREIEAGAWRAIAERFRLPAKIPAEVKVADDVALLTERRDLTTRHPAARPWREDESGLEPRASRIVTASAEAAERAFLEKFVELTEPAWPGGPRP